MKTNVLLLAFALVFASCGSHSPEVPTIKNDILDVEEVWLDDIATDIEIQPIVADYPLETFLTICGNDSEFVALDENLQTLYYVVDNRVVSRLKTIGRGPREYQNITDIAYLVADKTLYAYTPDRQCVYCYKMPGFEFVGKRDLKQDVNAMILLDDKNLLLTGYGYDSCANSSIYRYNLESGTAERIIETNYVSKTYTSTSSFCTKGGSVFFAMPGSDNIIYQYNSTALQPFARIDYGNYNFDRDLCNIDGNKIEDMIKYFSYTEEKDFAIGCYYLDVNNSSITYWHSPHIGKKFRKYYTVCKGSECHNYSIRIAGLNQKVFPMMIKNGVYTTIIDGDWESKIIPDEQLSPLAQRIVEAMKNQNDYNPVLVRFRLRNIF
ncbi:MAG: 6-bladed beta-propeller [Salinivirgaceae bacterium]|nr:6-bladed beta-propeller [Salinivirgaceae bacterium]